MEKINEQYFKELSEHRDGLANVLDDPALSGVKNSVVEKYSDQAHFIYELLQNADDAGATRVSFILENEKLIFIHDGIRRFTVSNPKLEKEHANIGKLGDINGITSIANSSKKNASNKIGKFGVGFKSVFQYTTAPIIYDPNIFFEIQRFIVPRKIEVDFNGRKENETVFVLPFNHLERKSKEAYEDIADKLENLDYPLMFLANIKEIEYKIGDREGRYDKKIIDTNKFEEVYMERVSMNQIKDGLLEKNDILLFSNKDIEGYRCSVGFLLSEEEKLIAAKYPAFCFFLTKETTALNFIIHAPFILTDSREGIKSGEQHNKKMVENIAKLAADSIVYMKDYSKNNGKIYIDDDILKIIPYDRNLFNEVDDKKKISFKPVYTAIKNKLKKEEILPASDGYVLKENAYLIEYAQWSKDKSTTKLFKDEQLRLLTGNENAKWAFTSFSRGELLRNQKELVWYLDDITKNWLGQERIISKINKEFIEKQSIEWLHKFYKYISLSKERIKLIKKKPIFINEDGKAVAAFDTKEQHILFLPLEERNQYETINKELLNNRETLEFIKVLNIQKPSLKDEIYNIILPKHNEDMRIEEDKYFLRFFKYYKSCSHFEMKDFIKLISKFKFIKYCTKDDKNIYVGTIDEGYFPNENLKVWFKEKKDTLFLDWNRYKELVKKEEIEELKRFFYDLEIPQIPKIVSREIDEKEAYGIRRVWARSTRRKTWIEKDIDGFEELIENISEKNSIIIWNELLNIISKSNNKGLRGILCGKYTYFYNKDKTEEFESKIIRKLKTLPWILNIKNEFMKSADIFLETLSEKYLKSSKEAIELIEFLEIQDKKEKLTDEQQKKIQLAESILDIPIKEIEKFAESYRRDNLIKNNRIEINNSNKKVLNIINDISKKINEKSINEEKNIDYTRVNEDNEAEIEDEDDYTKPIIDFSKKIEQAKEKTANEIAKITRLNEITEQIMGLKKYSYGWFKNLLELEILNNEGNVFNNKEISISFEKVERKENMEKTLILKYPNKNIPQGIEELTDIALELYFVNKERVKIILEAISIKSYTLRVKLRETERLDGLELNEISEAKIETKNPMFLLDELKKAFDELKLNNEYDMRINICKNIKFIFGPPGTGKTTYVVRKNIISSVKNSENIKILVLTPTNKACDVLARRTIEMMGKDKSYREWLIRFGVTADSLIEEEGILKDKKFDIKEHKKSVVITTIARFPYDYFIVESGERRYLKDIHWDYIIIDEASMIPLINILYPLYKNKPKEFIIAGDPFQIEPINSVNIWKGENIYSMIKLTSFANPITQPYQYEVELLTTQYRSIPEIGQIFSKFAYDGILKHNRKSQERRILSIEKSINAKPVNIIKFPVSKYESVYKAKRLKGKSNYQVYSALFTFEFIKYIILKSQEESKDETFRIGIIAPYKAQANLIDKLIARIKVPKNIDIQVGTIHGFQGDECEIIIAVFNPPPGITESNQMFLNKQNIINVAISRARDYLFLVMPDDKTENVENLIKVKNIESICKDENIYGEYSTQEIEKEIFGESTYIEDNSFATSHHLVNIYGEAEMKYEIRSEEDAIDIQIHER